MQELLNTEESDLSDTYAITNLGNDISALGSVPTAIYCFLKAQSEIPGIKVYRYLHLNSNIFFFIFRQIILLEELFSMQYH